MSMHQVFGSHIGHAIEMREAIDYLQGKPTDKRLHTLTMTLVADMLCATFVIDFDTAQHKVEKALNSGKAFEKFAQMLHTLGAVSDFLQHIDHYLKPSAYQLEVTANTSGYVQAVDAYALGITLIKLDSGRKLASDTIDYPIGLTDCANIGEYRAQGDLLASSTPPVNQRHAQCSMKLKLHLC